MENHDNDNFFDLIISGVWLEVLSRISGAISGFIFGFIDSFLPDNDPAN